MSLFAILKPRNKPVVITIDLIKIMFYHSFVRVYAVGVGRLTKNREVIMNYIIYESKCPDCGNVDRLSKEETERTVHCQACYKHYDYLENDFLKGYTVLKE